MTLTHPYAMSSQAIQRCLTRMAHEILEANDAVEELLLIGIHAGGVPIAKRIAKLIEASEGSSPHVGEMDITLYRDDLYTGLERPVLGETKIPVALRGRTVVLIDDVLFTGRTVRAALDELMDYGRPEKIQLAVLVERGHRELPIAANFVGRTMETERTDRVQVTVGEEPAAGDGVCVERNGEVLK